MKAIAVAVPNRVQSFKPHLSRSLPTRTVIPAEAHAAANVRVDVICNITETPHKLEMDSSSNESRFRIP